MEEQPAKEEEREQAPPRRQWVEPVAALIMALATVGTAWSSYQSAAWTRKSGRLMQQCNTLERNAGLLSLQGMQSLTIQTAMFMQVIAAKQAGNEALAGYYVERFPPDARKAYDAWIAQNPLENPNADPHPFVPKLYQLRGSDEAAASLAQTAGILKEASIAGNVSGQYLANTVLFATVLFFANAAGKFGQRRVRTVAFLFAAAVFAYAMVRIAILPR